jgi:hypothetical protein
MTTLQHHSNTRILEDLSRAVHQERRSLTAVLRLLAEVDRRALFAELGYFSLFEYCTEALRYSEHEAYLRIGVARAARRFPRLLDMIDRGELHLTGAARCAPHLSRDNERELLDAVVHKSKREIEQILAAMFPQPDLPDGIEPVSASPSEKRHTVHPLAEDRFAVCFTASRRCVELLERARALSAHRHPRPGFAELVEAALESYVEKLEKQKFKETDRPRGQPAQAAQPAEPLPSEDSRRIPAAVKREVYRRDGGRCTYVGPDGHRCSAQAFLEYDHILPVARGGTSNADNLRLRCFTHNQLTAKRELGAPHMTLMAQGFRPVSKSLVPERALANAAALLAMQPLDSLGPPARDGA